MSLTLHTSLTKTIHRPTEEEDKRFREGIATLKYDPKKEVAIDG